MKFKDLILKYKIRLRVMLIYNRLKLEIEQIVKENKLEYADKNYLEGYLEGIEDFLNLLMKDDIEILKE